MFTDRDARRFSPFFAATLLCAGIAWHDRRSANEAYTWPATKGIVSSSSVTEIPGDTTNWRVDVGYSYDVGGVTYHGGSLTGDVVPYLSEEAAHAKAAQYPPGASITVHYRPDGPAVSVVEREAHSQRWMSIAGFGIALSLFGLIHVVNRRRRDGHHER